MEINSDKTKMWPKVPNFIVDTGLERDQIFKKNHTDFLLSEFRNFSEIHKYGFWH